MQVQIIGPGDRLLQELVVLHGEIPRKGDMLTLDGMGAFQVAEVDWRMNSQRPRSVVIWVEKRGPKS
jgi:hypothetical protein